MRPAKLVVVATFGSLLQLSAAIAHPGHGARKSTASTAEPTAAAASVRPLTIRTPDATERGTFVMARDGLVQTAPLLVGPWAKPLHAIRSFLANDFSKISIVLKDE